MQPHALTTPALLLFRVRQSVVLTPGSLFTPGRFCTSWKSFTQIFMPESSPDIGFWSNVMLHQIANEVWRGSLIFHWFYKGFFKMIFEITISGRWGLLILYWFYKGFGLIWYYIRLKCMNSNCFEYFPLPTILTKNTVEALICTTFWPLPRDART